jgi:hypothetical protein
MPSMASTALSTMATMTGERSWPILACDLPNKANG